MTTIFHKRMICTLCGILAVLFFSGTALCQTLPQEPLALARHYAELAQRTVNKGEKSRIALLGIAAADSCVQAYPTRGACLYYRGISRGLELETHILGIKDGLRQILDDFNTARRREPSYDGGGPSRALGYLYLQLPSFILGSEFKRDLNRAQTFADEALRHDGQHPDNWLLQGLIAEKRGDAVRALFSFKSGLKIFDTLQTVPIDLAQVKADLEKNIDKLTQKMK